MAIKTFYATGAFKYNHRMLMAGDPVDMDAPTSRLYTHLGKISPRKPKAARVAADAQAIRDDLAQMPTPKPVTLKANPSTAPKRKPVAPNAPARKRRRAKK